MPREVRRGQPTLRIHRSEARGEIIVRELEERNRWTAPTHIYPQANASTKSDGFKQLKFVKRGPFKIIYKRSLVRRILATKSSA